MDLDLNQIEKTSLQEIGQAKTTAILEELRIKYLGRKSPLSLFLRGLKDKPAEERAKLGKLSNDIKRKIELEFEKKLLDIKEKELNQKIAGEKLDVTAPGKKVEQGHLHPLTLVKREIESIFHSMGFETIEGPEVETEWYNFDALNVPADHPARDMQDTFWLKQPEKLEKDPRRRLLPRTHTTAVDVRFLEKHQPPFRIIAPGRVFRNEATDITHDVQFYQFDTLMVGHDVSLANLKGIVQQFYKKFFKKDVEVRFVCTYFPFTEPSVEIQVKIGGNTRISNRWIEMAGAGMLHQNVFKAAGYAPGEWQGFAFGMTIDRLAMMKYGIDDIRLLYSGDLRFLNQF